MPRELVLRVLARADADVVLVDGQALAFWMDHYDVRQRGDLPAIFRDVDLPPSVISTTSLASVSPPEHAMPHNPSLPFADSTAP